MGYITLNNGEVVHTSSLNQNPVVKTYSGKTWIENGIYYTEQISELKNGEKQIAVLSYLIQFK